MATVTFTRLSTGVVKVVYDSNPTYISGPVLIDPNLADDSVRIVPSLGDPITLVTADTVTINGVTAGTGADVRANLLATGIFFLTKPPTVVASKNTSASHTGDTTRTTVFTFTLPANTLLANGSLHMIAVMKWTNNANAKTFRIEMGGQTILQYATTTSQTARIYTIIANRNATNVQVMAGTNTSGPNAGFNSSSTGDVATYALDTTADITINLTVQLGVGTDTGSFEMFEAIAYPKN